MELSIVIVSWNVEKLLAKCLASILKHQKNLELEIIVVDNASTDNTLKILRENFPGVAVIANSENLGFAAANNQGILKAKADFILILNPDTEIINGALQKIIDLMKQNDQIGIAGAKHLNPDWTIQPSVRRFPGFWPIFFILTKIAKIFPNLSPVYNYLAKDFNYQISQPADQVAGSCLMIRRKTIDEIGMFDENFFIWFEEVDLCKRAKAAGWQVWYTAEAEIIHHGGQSFKQQLTFKKQLQFFKSAWYYFKKHGFRKDQILSP